MVTVANDPGRRPQDLPAGDYGLPVRDLLGIPSLRGSTVLGGAKGLDRIVRRLNVMEVPDILPWVKPHELLLTTGFPLRHAGGSVDVTSGAAVAALVQLVCDLDARGLAAVGVKLGRYLDEVPRAVVSTADELGFPLIRVPSGVAFDDVISDVFTALLDRQSAAVRRTDEVHRALAAIVLAGGDLPQIADEVARLLDAAVLICTPDGRVQAHGGTPDARQRLAALPLHDPTGRFRVEQLTPGTAADWSGDLVSVPILAGGVDHGRIVAYRSGGELRTPGRQALERAATVAALAIVKQLAVSAVESKFRGDFLRDVLAGTAGEASAVIEHCESLGWDIDRPMVVVVAELDPGDRQPAHEPPTVLRSPHERFTAAWQQVVRAHDRAAPVVGFRQEVVTLLPVDVPADADATQGRRIAAGTVDHVVTAVSGDRGGGRRSFCAGVSRVVHGPVGIADAYVQARKAVAVGRRTRGPGTVAHFDSLGVHRLLSLVPDPGELRAFADEVLRELASTTPEAADLRRTLQTLLDTNLNVAETARALHFHYNTLRYRIGKLERIVGPFTTDPHLRLDVALALQVIEMRGL
jgi:PucR family transcriptional regulator, purine catabolism regulatory protein